ncbi:MAG: hypothetical protein V1809_12720 [Planctomycetota bacterium]
MRSAILALLVLAAAPAAAPAADSPASPAALPESPEVRGETEELVRMYEEARRLYESGFYEKAAALCETILTLDRRNRKGRDMLYKCKMALYERNLREEMDLAELGGKRALIGVERDRIVPPEKDKILPPAIRFDDVVSREEEEAIKAKLATPVRMSYNDTPLLEIFYHLGTTSGLNIIANPQDLSGKNLTVLFADQPLSAVLDYIARYLGVTYIVKDNAIWVMTPDKPYLEHQIFHLRRGLTEVGAAMALIGNSGSGGGGGGGGGLFGPVGGGGGGGGNSPTGAAGGFGKTDIEKLLEWMEKSWAAADPVYWPPGSTWNLDRKTNTLFVLSTKDTLRKMEALIQEVDITPVQILIKTRFISTGIDDLSELGVQWQLAGNWGIDQKGSGNRVQADTGSGTNFNMPFPGDTGFPSTGGNVALSGILSDPQFKAVLHALERKGNSVTLTAPEVTTLNNQPAVISAEENYPYVTGYTQQSNTTTYISGTVPVNTQNTGALIPQIGNFNVGPKLEVTPSVGIDNQTITLLLHPKVNEYKETKYFDVIQSTDPNVVKYPQIAAPVFANRELTTQMIIHDGQTVVLGGLSRAIDTKAADRVPFLGRIPILGLLFGSRSDRQTKSNLLIFVTASILTPDGRQYIRPEVSAVDLPAPSALRNPENRGTAPAPSVRTRIRPDETVPAGPAPKRRP